MRINHRASHKLALFIHVIIIGVLVASCQIGAGTQGAFWIDSSRDLGEISKFVLGANHGPWADLGASNLEPAKNSGITFLRWPGGNWGDQNDVQTYQIDNYITQAHLMGAEPSITVRLLGSTPEKAAQLVKYVNIDKKYGVKYWSIGNEPDLYVIQDSTWTPEYYAKTWRNFAVAMKAVDPTIQLYGPEISAFLGDKNSFDPREFIYVNSAKQSFTKRDYLTEFLKVNADLVDIVAVHQYPFPKHPNDGVPSWEQLRDNTPEWDRILPNLHRIIRETIGSDKPVAITEFNSDASSSMGSKTSPDSFLNAIWLADVMGRTIRTQPDILAYWLLKNNSAGHGLMDSFNVRPTYYTYQIYKQFGNHLLAATSPEQYVSLFAAKRDDGTITAIFVNRGDQEVSKPFEIQGGDNLKLTEVYLFDAKHNAQSIAPPNFKNGDKVSLPAYSVTLYILK